VAGPNADRDARITAAARLGQTHEAIAREYGIGRARVSQIVTAANPRSLEESQRQLIADRLRSRWDELEKIVRDPPPMHSAIGKVVVDAHGNPVINASAVIQAIKTQLQIVAQFRQMFGMDLASRPGPAFDEAAMLKLAEIRVAQRQLAAQAPVTLPALPADYATLPPAQQARADLERRAAIQAQRAAIQRQAEDDDIPEAEIVDE
jgi:hypothetical protein